MNRKNSSNKVINEVKKSNISTSKSVLKNV